MTILRGHVVLRLRLVEREAGARRRRAERSGFVPGAGRMAAKVATAKVVEGVALALRAAIR